MGRARKKVPCGRVLSATPWRATQARPSERARAAALRQNGSRIHCARCALRSLPQDAVRRGATEGRASVYVVPPSVCLSYYKICLRRRGGFPCLSLALRSSRPVWSFFRSSRPLRSLFEAPDRYYFRNSRPVRSFFFETPDRYGSFFRNSRPVRSFVFEIPDRYGSDFVKTRASTPGSPGTHDTTTLLDLRTRNWHNVGFYIGRSPLICARRSCWPAHCRASATVLSRKRDCTAQ